MMLEKITILDLGEGWAPTILNDNDEVSVLEQAVSQSCLYTWVGGSSNVGPSCAKCNQFYTARYMADYSGTNQTKTLMC